MYVRSTLLYSVSLFIRTTHRTLDSEEDVGTINYLVKLHRRYSRKTPQVIAGYDPLLRFAKFAAILCLVEKLQNTVTKTSSK